MNVTLETLHALLRESIDDAFRVAFASDGASVESPRYVVWDGGLVTVTQKSVLTLLEQVAELRKKVESGDATDVLKLRAQLSMSQSDVIEKDEKIRDLTRLVNLRDEQMSQMWKKLGEEQRKRSEDRGKHEEVVAKLRQAELSLVARLNEVLAERNNLKGAIEQAQILLAKKMKEAETHE